MLLGPVALLLLRSDIMYMISLFVHGLMKIDSLLFQEMIKRFMSEVNI